MTTDFRPNVDELLEHNDGWTARAAYRTPGVNYYGVRCDPSLLSNATTTSGSQTGTSAAAWRVSASTKRGHLPGWSKAC